MEKFKISLELDIEEVKKLKEVVCIGLIVGNDERMPEDNYTIGAKLANTLNEIINYDLSIILNEEDTNRITEHTLKPYIRSCVKFMYKAELVEINSQ